MAKQIHTALSILRRKQVEARIGLSRSTIYERIKAGTFPAPISLGAKSVGWIESEIDDWLSSQVEKSRKAN
jgi:prophage regulatory protein